MPKHLFLLTIGPVQSFIAQARKTQDLFAGSRILSHLIKEGIQQIPNWKEQVIFPILDESDKHQSLPNRFVAIVEKPEEELKQFGVDVENKIRQAFQQQADTTFREAPMRKHQKPQDFDTQIERHLNIHWVFQPLKEDDYQKSYQAATALLSSIKNVRPFEQFGNGAGEAGRKCNLDGENNALFFGRKKPSLRIKDQKHNSTILNGFKTDEKEGLSAVSFTKRYYQHQHNESFPSTAEVAIQHDLKQLSSEKKEIFNCFKGLFDKNEVARVCIKILSEGWIKELKLNNISSNEDWNSHFDFQAIFEENLTKKVFPDATQLKLAKILQAKLATSFKTNYYALLMFDGDKMGDLLAKNASLKFHVTFSALLANFAKIARKEVDKCGQTVYAGGDDFLGFVNIHHLFEVMTTLRTLFNKEINDKLELDKSLTFSAGIVIAHYKMPLSEVLKTVRKVEKKAKNEGGRDAFCITAIRHSGEIQEAVFKWGADNEHWNALQYITTQLKKSVFSNKFIVNLTVELYQLAGLDLEKIELPDKAFLAEFERLIKRALIKRINKEKDKQTIDKMVEQLTCLFNQSDENANIKGIQNFIHLLHIADFFSRKTKLKNEN